MIRPDVAPESGIVVSMKLSHLLSFVCGAILMLGAGMVTRTPAQTPGHVYELRMYHANEGKLDAIVSRFRDHSDAIFKRHNIKSVGYWLPQDPPNAGNLLIYVLEHPSRQEADKNWAAFNADPEWMQVRKVTEANGALISKVDRYFMTPTDFSAMK
jgi:hypothetical protein